MSAHVVLIPVLCLLVLFLPGLVIGRAAGLRVSVALPVAPLLTYGVTTATATVASYVRFPWNPLTLVLVTVAVTLMIAGARSLRARRLPPWRSLVRRPRVPSWQTCLVTGGVLAGGVLSAGVLLAGFGRLDAPNQDYDNIFHANAVRLISDSGDIAPAAMRRIGDWESNSFYYPNTFHALAALVRDLTGASVFEVLNSEAMIVCLVAGLGLVALLVRLRAPLAVVVCTPVLLAGFASFPYDVLWRGPLLPYAAGVAVIPAFVLLLDVALTSRRPIVVVLAGVGAAGLLGLHPSAALSAALFAGCCLVRRWWISARTLGADLLILVSLSAVTLLLAFPALIGAVTTGADGPQVNWLAVESPGQAAGDLFLLNHDAPGPQYWLAGLLVVGLIAVHRAQYLWGWLGGAALSFALFVLAAASDGPLAEFLTRPWWNDRWRFAALAVLGFAPLAAHGLLTLAQFAQRALTRWPSDALRGRLSGRTVTGALVAVGLALVAVLSGGLYASSNTTRMSSSYQHQRTLDSAEITSMQWLRRHSSGGTIMNEANDGSAYLLAVAGLHPLFGRVVEPASIPAMGRTQQLLLEHFNCLDSDPAVRRAIERLQIRYVFLGSGHVRDYLRRLPGLLGLNTSPSLRVIHSVPGVSIYQVALTPASTAPIAACTEARTGGAPSQSTG
ncbi:MAG: DUF6541 family protein [Blastococcus sp.]